MSTRGLIKLWVVVAALTALSASAQTSWKSTSSIGWSTAANWTATVSIFDTDAIIADKNFPGANHPTVNAAAVCKSLTIGAGTKASTLTVRKPLTILYEI